MAKVLFIFLFAFHALYAQEFNEICPSNVGAYEPDEVIFDPDASGPLDWVELYNSTGATINLGGYSLTDDLDEGAKWHFPPGFLTAGELLIIEFFSGTEHPSIVNFSLPKEGGVIYLLNTSMTVIDSLHYPAIQRNHSYGKIGSKFYYFDTPTPELPNSIAIGYNGYSSGVNVNYSSGQYPAGTHIVLSPVNELETVSYAINGQSLAASSTYTTAIVLTETISIKAVSKGDSLIYSEPRYATYFVDESHTLPVVHLTIDSLELFDETTGIIMHGPAAYPYPPYADANFWKDVEIDAHFAYFDSDLQLRDALSCGLKVHGGAGSRIQDMKSFQIIGKNSFDTRDFHYHYFPDKNITEFRRLVLRNSGNDFCKSYLKDGILQQYFLENDLDIDLMAYSPVTVMINGAYWGLMNLREKTDQYYLSSNYGLDVTEVNLLEKNPLTELQGSNSDFLELINYAKSNDLNQAEHYQWIHERLDIHSMVDYFCVQFYINNIDWPHNNIKVWNAPGYKWRFLCYDLDYGLQYHGTSFWKQYTIFNKLTNLPENNNFITLFIALVENEEFKRYFINRYADLLNSLFRSDRFMPRIAKGKAKIETAIKTHYEKWCGGTDQWSHFIENMNVFIEERPEIVHADLIKSFQLKNKARLRIDNYPSNAGKTQLNTIILDSFPFEGTYFESNRINLTAIPNEGQIFKHWENIRTGEKWTSPSIMIDPQQNDEFIANYQSKNSRFHLSVVPNPVDDILRLNYSLPNEGEVFIEITAPSGQKIIITPSPQFQEKGTQNFNFNISNLNAGIYLVTLTTPDGIESIRIYKN